MDIIIDIGLLGIHSDANSFLIGLPKYHIQLSSLVSCIIHKLIFILLHLQPLSRFLE